MRKILCYNRNKGCDCLDLYILSEPLFVKSPWYKTICTGLVSELGRRKLHFSDCGIDILPQGVEGESFAFLLGTNVKWLNECIASCGRLNIHPIVLGTQGNEGFCGICSVVTSNLSHSMNYLLSYLASNGKRKTALYGVNRLSTTNLAQMEQFKGNTVIPCTDEDIYFNEGSISDCSDMFIENIDKYDSVISVNDFATVSLMRKLNKIGREITIVSYGGTRLAKKYFPELLTVSMGYESFGKAAASICETMNANKALDCLTVQVKCVIDNETEAAKATRDVLPEKTPNGVDSTDTRFYGDSEMNDLIKIENMLLLCDEIDSEIINLLMSGYSYEDIAEKLYCALNTVKYRVRKMKEACGCDSKRELIAMIKSCCEH